MPELIASGVETLTQAVQPIVAAAAPEGASGGRVEVYRKRGLLVDDADHPMDDVLYLLRAIGGNPSRNAPLDAMAASPGPGPDPRLAGQDG